MTNYPSLFVFLLFLMIVWNSHLGFSQTDTTNYHYEYDTVIVERKIRKLKFEEYQEKDMDFYLSPLALLEPCPTLYFGTEYFLKNKVSIYTDVGYIFSFRRDRDFDDMRTPYSSRPNYVIKPEIRFYTKNNPQKASYHAIKFLFRNMNYKEEQFVYDEYFFDENTQSWSVSGEGKNVDYRVRRRSLGVQYIKGWKGRFIQNWTTNFYFGLGMRYVSNKLIDKRPSPFRGGRNVWEIDFLKLDKQYKFMMLDVALGVRIGSKLKR